LKSIRHDRGSLNGKAHIQACLLGISQRHADVVARHIEPNSTICWTWTGDGNAQRVFTVDEQGWHDPASDGRPSLFRSVHLAVVTDLLWWRVTRFAVQVAAQRQRCCSNGGSTSPLLLFKWLVNVNVAVQFADRIATLFDAWGARSALAVVRVGIGLRRGAGHPSNEGQGSTSERLWGDGTKKLQPPTHHRCTNGALTGGAGGLRGELVVCAGVGVCAHRTTAG
jgi:hypothetical protein